MTSECELYRPDFYFVPLNNPGSLVTNYMVFEKRLSIFFGFCVIRRYTTTFIEFLFGNPSKPVDFIQCCCKVKLGSILWVVFSQLLSRAHFSTSNYDVTEFEGMWRKVIVRHFREFYECLSGGNLR